MPTFRRDALHDRRRKPAVTPERCAIVVGDRLRHRVHRGRGDDLQSAHEDPGRLVRLRCDRQWQHRIDRAAGNQIEQSSPFLEPGIPPRFKHGLGFARIESSRDQHLLDLMSQSGDIAIQRQRLNGQSLVALQLGVDAIAKLVPTLLKENHPTNRIFRVISDEDLSLFNRPR